MTVDRRDFIPERVWPFDPESDTYGRAVDRETDPEGWERAVRADVPLVTQWDDGQHVGPEPGRLATSSASMPRAVATMLDALNIRADTGGSYLDVGTGTGYTAARIAELVGPAGIVTTIEVDPVLAASARANLARAGVTQVEVITGDGFEGWEAAAPYNGVHVTCGIRRISPHWITQCLPGAKVVLPWGTDYTPHDRLLTLTVNNDGTASGNFSVGLSFMKMRAQRLAFAGHRAYTPDGWQDAARETDSDLEPAEAKEVLDDDGAFAVSVRVPDCVMNAAHEDDGSVSIWLYSTREDRSVAVGAFGDGYAPNIIQAGPRALWDEVARAREWWVRRGKPEAERFGLIARGGEQRIWLDDPGGESWAL